MLVSLGFRLLEKVQKPYGNCFYSLDETVGKQPFPISLGSYTYLRNEFSRE